MTILTFVVKWTHYFNIIIFQIFLSKLNSNLKIKGEDGSTITSKTSYIERNNLPSTSKDIYEFHSDSSSIEDDNVKDKDFEISQYPDDSESSTEISENSSLKQINLTNTKELEKTTERIFSPLLCQENKVIIYVM